MNFLKKIGVAIVGIAMAVGVGVGASTSKSVTSVKARSVTLRYSFTINGNDFNTTSYAANNNEKSTTATCSTTDYESETLNVNWTSNQVMKNSGNMQWQKNAGYIYNSTNLGTIISVTVNSSAGSFTTYYGTTAQPTSGAAGSGKGYFKTSVGNATGTTTSVVVVFEKSKTVDDFTQTITKSPDADSMREDGSMTLTTNADSANWTITSGSTLASLSAASGKTVTLSGSSKGAGSVTVSATATDYANASVTIGITAKPADSKDIVLVGEHLNWAAGSDTNVTTGSNATLEIEPDATYNVPSSVSLEGKYTSFEYADGILEIVGVADNITVTATAVPASIVSISLNTSNVKKAFTLGDEFAWAGLVVNGTYNDPYNTTLPLNSGYTVDSSNYNGFAEAKAGGTPAYYTINVSYPNTSGASYNVTVSRKTIEYTTTYELVTASKTNWSGKYVILNSTEAYVLGNIISNNRVTNGTLPTVSNHVISAGYADYVYTITKVGDYYTISPDAGANAGKLLSGTSVKNQAQYLASNSTDDLTKWTISFSNGVFDLVNYGRTQAQSDSANAYLRQNTTSGWACYATGTGTKPALYEKVDTASGSKSLISITATVDKSVERIIGDQILANQFTVTAHYDTLIDDKTVTENLTFPGGNILSAASNDITIRYTEGGVYKEFTVTGIPAAERDAELVDITWSQSGITALKGSTLPFSSLADFTANYDDDSHSEKAVNAEGASLALYTKTGESTYSKYGSDLSNNHAWAIDEDGKYFGLKYETADVVYSSSPVKIVDTLEQIKKKDNVPATRSWEVSSTDEGTNPSLTIGTATATFARAEGGSSPKWYTGAIRMYANNTLAISNATNITSITLTYGSTKSATLSANVGTFSDDTTSSSKTWTGNAREIVFTAASSGQKYIAGISITYESVVETPINNTADYLEAQYQVIKFAKEFLLATNSVCEMDGSSNLSSWATTIKATYTDNRPANGDNQTYFDNLIKFADSAERDGDGLTPDGDVLQKALARYDWIVAHHNGAEDFLNTTSGRAAVNATRIGTLASLKQEISVTTIILIVSIAGIAAVGGYFLLKKRKEI